jgi:hypothetical protein
MIKKIKVWKFIGYYFIDIEQPDGEIFYPYENAGITTFYSNNTFDSLIDSVNYTGTYSVSVDSVLTVYYNQTVPNSPIGGGGVKISLLNNTALEMKDNSTENFDLTEIYRYEKVTNP